MKSADKRTFFLLSIFLCLLAVVLTGYVLNGYQWPVGSNVRYYINANTPQVPDEAGAVTSAAAGWSRINSTGLRMTYSGSSTAVDYGYNGTNTICWKNEGGSGALATAYTWYSGSRILETDMVFNDYYSWSTSGGQYDVETVALHELGHWVGLGHSTIGIMRPSYSGIQRSIDSDARAGFEALYGSAGGSDPVIELDKSSLSFTGSQEKTFRIRNAGEDVLQFTLTSDRPWLELSPDSGISSGDWRTISVRTDTKGMQPGNYSGTVSALAAGASNSPQSLKINLAVINDLPPTISITFPKNKAVLKNTVLVKAFAADDKGIRKVEFYIGSRLKKTDRQAPYTWSWDTSRNSSGSQVLRVKAYDTIDQTAEASVQVTVDQPPTIAFIDPKSGDELSGRIDIKIEAKDDIKVDKVEIFIDGSLVSTDSAHPFIYSWDTAELLNRNYWIKAKVFDSRGQWAQSEIPVSIRPHAPMNFSGMLSNNSSVLLEQYINILNWQTNPANQDISIYRIYIHQSGNWTLLAQVESGVSEYRHLDVDENQTYEYRLIAIDGSGREGDPAELRLNGNGTE